MQGITRRLEVPPITLAEYDRRKAAGDTPKLAALLSEPTVFDTDREVEVKLTQADAGRILGLIEGDTRLGAAELALRLAIYRAAN